MNLNAPQHSTCRSLATFLLLSLLGALNVYADERPLYIIFDGSNSMWGNLDDKTRKIDSAKQVFHELQAELLQDRDLALRIYGHRRAKDCSDTELAVPIAPSATSLTAITKRIDQVLPRGKTPIRRSLNAALKDLDGRPADILLISDGIETCDADPCELVQNWRDQDVDVKVHVVGLGLQGVAREAMQCIADAAGTRYLDARNASELGNAIASTVIDTEAAPRPQLTEGEFYLEGVDERGRTVPVAGTLFNDSNSYQVKSQARHQIPSGDYQLTAGVPTANGALYQPITIKTSIDASKTLHLSVDVLRPPVIRTRFVQNGQPAQGALTAVTQGGQTVFNMRIAEEYFVLPGSYRFDSSPNQDNQLSVEAHIGEGDDRDIVFDLTTTVHTTIIVTAGDPPTRLRQHQQLWQNGEQMYHIHYANGAPVKPGSYTLRSEDQLTPYQIENLQIPPVAGQQLQIAVPMAQVTLQYRFQSTPDTKDYRCWLEPISPSGDPLRQSRALQCDGSSQLLAAGRYRVVPWSRLGNFQETVFDVNADDTSDISIPQIVE